jgi:hypothetical protein
MNLLCPNCQKMLQVPEQYAGQLMKCPLCTGTFTVPALPTPPPAPPPMPAPAPADNLGFSAEPSGAPAHRDLGVPSGPPPAGYMHQRSYTFSPRVIPWIAPLAMLIVFIALFFPWVGVYPGGIGAVTQNGWNAAFGGYSESTIWNKYYVKDEPEDLKIPPKDLGAGVLLVFCILFLLPGLVVALIATLMHQRLIPVELPPSLTNYWSYRPLLVTLLGLGALVFLILQLASGFPLENETRRVAEKRVTKPEGKPTEEDEQKYQMDVGREVGKYNLQTTTWLKVSVVLLALAVIGALLDYWLERRGAQPPPRIDVLT